MEWTGSIQRAIQALEQHLLEEEAAGMAARAAALSPFYLERGFKMMTGFSIGEYVRFRRLYLAALDVLSGEEKIIDLAFRYGYETPESFTKAFSRFHGLSPLQLKKEPRKIRVFLPLKIEIAIRGGNEMDFTVEKMPAFQVIGFKREFVFETAYQQIPEFWDEMEEKYARPMLAGKAADTAIDRVFRENHIGEFGVCVEDEGMNGRFSYLIAGKWQGGEVPEDMTVYQFPEMLWAKFPCIGPMPGALQSVNTKIFQQWLPNNSDYEIALGANIEWYSPEGSPQDADYQSAIWVPVRKKE